MNTKLQSPLSMPYEEQQQVTRLCVRCALLLMQYGGEAATVVDLTKRLGVALGMDSVQCSTSFNTVALTTVHNDRCITTSRDTINQVINVSILVQIQQIVNSTEKRSTEQNLVDSVQEQFDGIDRSIYPKRIIVTFVGISCAGFAYLHGGNLLITAITFVAGSVAMLVKIYLSKYHFNTFITVIATALIASLIGASTYFINDYIPSTQINDMADIAVASSVVLLIPSFPLINALSDILKGYLNMGMGRLVFAIMLSISACVGIVIALSVLKIQQWGI